MQSSLKEARVNDGGNDDGGVVRKRISGRGGRSFDNLRSYGASGIEDTRMRVNFTSRGEVEGDVDNFNVSGGVIF